MGKNQKRASRLQAKSAPSKTVSLRAFDFSNIGELFSQTLAWIASKHRAPKILFAIFATLLSICIFCYQPARIYYVQLRDTQKATVELAAIQKRNDAISKKIEVLKTDEGIKDKATSDYGYVRLGEWMRCLRCRHE